MTGGPLLMIDRAASLVTIAGRRFPAVALICPPDPGDDDRTDWSRSLATGGGDQSVYVPAENGLLFRVEEGESEDHRGLSLDLHARTCELTDDGMWLPRNIGLVGGDLIAGAWNLWYWAEPDWVVETIDRVSRKPFTQPPGPPVQLVRLDYFKEPAHAD